MSRHSLLAAALCLASLSATAAEPCLHQTLAAQGQRALTEIHSELRAQVNQDLENGVAQLLQGLRSDLIAELPEQMRQLTAPTLAAASATASIGVMALEESTPDIAVTLH